MNKRLITVGFLILAVSIVLKFVFTISKNIKIDDFHKTAVIFVLDSSASNQNQLAQEVRYIKSLCSILDPEDEIKILNVDKNSYLIYEGSPGDSSGISKAINTYSKNDGTDYGTAYGEAIKKSIEHSLAMKKEGYRSAIVIVGDLEDGNSTSQINWDTLPKNIEKAKQYMPELAMMFVYASPVKLDLVKTKLNPIFGETKLIIANSANADKASRRFITAIGR